MKMDLRAENLQGLAANLYARHERFQGRVLTLNQEYAEYTRNLAEQLASKDTWYMSTQIRTDFSEDGYRWSVGYFAEDFEGVTNPMTGERIDFPYYLVQELGSVDQPPQPHLFPAYEEMRPLYTADLSQLLRDVIAEGR